MQKVNLLTLTEGVFSWAELEPRIASLSSEQERGEVFEQFRGKQRKAEGHFPHLVFPRFLNPSEKIFYV